MLYVGSSLKFPLKVFSGNEENEWKKRNDVVLFSFVVLNSTESKQETRDWEAKVYDCGQS